jgi:hypothetical protein
MISIIICARQNDISEELKKNIEETIGTEYEIIVIDNSQNQYSIFSAYNKGVSLSKYPLLLFMHDDINYHTQQWGVKLINHFRDESVGAVGVAGTPYLAFTTGGWWSAGAGHLHLLQSPKRNEKPELHNFFPKNSAKEEVVILDGVWFCIRKDLFTSIRFDETTFSGFHFYDVDATFQVYQAGYKLLCVKDILIHHLSMGVLDQKWAENAILFHKKWKDKLPAAVQKYSLSDQCIMEYRMVNEFLNNRLRIGQQKKSKIYLDALKSLLSFKKGYRYFKTPFWASAFLGKYLFHRLAGR